MNKKLIIIFISLALAFTTMACSVCFFSLPAWGSGRLKKETRSISEFSSVQVSGGIQLYFTQGKELKLEIEAEDNMLDLIETRVRGKELHIGYKWGSMAFPTKPVIVNLTTDTLESIGLSGGSTFECDSLTSSELRIDISGGGDSSLQKVKVDSLELNLSGGSTTDISGKTEDLDINLSGGSGVKAKDLESASAKVKISGGGKATIWVEKTLDANLSGGSNLYYYGSPKVTQNMSGGSDLIPEGEH